MINSPETKILKKAIVKWGEIPVNDEHLRGTIKIFGFRKYSLGAEVDIIFEGEIYGRMNRKSEWYDSKIFQAYKNISKIKTNRFIRKRCFNYLVQRLNYFDVRLIHYSQIKKINWK